MKCGFSILLMGWLTTSFQCWEIVDKFNYENNEELYQNNDFGNNTNQNELTGHHFPDFVERPLVNEYDSGDQQDDITWRINSASTTAAVYDYDQLKNEFDLDISRKNAEKAKLNRTEFKLPDESSCEAQKLYNFGPVTAFCLISEYLTSDSAEVRKKSAGYLNTILIIWLVIFSICFFVGWAHYGKKKKKMENLVRLGCLNILCPFAMCFPDDTYEGIKHYLVLNPPGVLTESIDRKKDLKSKTKFKRVVYKASESEYYLYNSLWHDIYHV